jgi:hypothetical protein
MSKQTKQIITDTNLLFQELSFIIDQSKQQVVSAVNNALTVLFWHIGKKINTHVLRHKRAEYGKQIVAALSRQLVAEYGNNFEEKNLRRMMQFAEHFPDIEIVVTLSRQLSWSHFLVLIPLKNLDAKIFYAEMSARERWGVRELRKQIENKIFERKAVASIQLHQDYTAERRLP